MSDPSPTDPSPTDPAGFWASAVGRSAVLDRVFTETDLAGYAELTGDDPGDSVPEPLIAGLFSTLLGTDLPGSGTMYLKQDLRFDSRVRPGERVSASVTITSVRPDKALVNLHTVATAGDRAVCAGEALVMARQFTP